MTRRKKLKRRIRQRKGKTQERYTAARRQVLKAEAKRQDQDSEANDLRGVTRAYTSPTANAAVMKHLQMLKEEVDSASLALQQHLRTNPALGIQQQIQAQIAALRTLCELGDLVRPIYEMNTLLLHVDPALEIQKQIQAQVAAARAPLNELEQRFSEVEKLLRPVG